MLTSRALNGLSIEDSAVLPVIRSRLVYPDAVIFRQYFEQEIGLETVQFLHADKIRPVFVKQCGNSIFPTGPSVGSVGGESKSDIKRDY